VTTAAASFTRDRRLLALSVTVQLALGVLLGHAYDARIFMTTGYLVATGRGPYSPLDLGAVFQHVGFGQLTTIGYPPPWPLVTGLAYRATYGLAPNLHVYDLALKLPVIAATVGLAYLVAGALRWSGAPAETCRKAWIFLLFNPLILLAGAAWGQIDVIVALLTVAALVLVLRGRWASSAALLALAVCTKPTPLPAALVVLVWLAARAPREALRYAAVFLAWAAVFVVVPIAALGWSTAQIQHRPNAQFLMAGGLSYTTVARLVRDQPALPGHWWLIGLLWVVALPVGLVLWRRGDGFDDLVRGSAALTLVFLLTRAWLAEPNVVLVLPLVLILASLGDVDRRLLTALWLIPLAFAVANLSPLQLLWLTFPDAWRASVTAVGAQGAVLLPLRAALVVAWQVAGWWTVAVCLRRAPAPVHLRELAA
jgi:Glycosyltransferase family 87